MQTIRYTFLIAFILVYQHTAFAQAVQDTAFVSLAAKNTIQVYSDYIKAQSSLYNGTEYKTPQHNDAQHPFYIDYDWQWGNVIYNEQSYDRVPLLYDLTTDDLITEHYEFGQELMLVKAKVNAFTLGDHKFVHLFANATNGLPQSGFYEQFYEGPTQVVSRFWKVYEEKIDNRTLVYFYNLKQRHYLMKDGKYNRVKNRGDVLKLMKDQKAAIRNYISQNNIKVSTPGSFAKIARHYDSLTNGK